MSEIVIKVENLSKQYRLGEVGTGTISHDLNRWWAKIRGKEDPFLKIGETNNRSKKGNSEYVWALKDINFEVKQGEVLGIIGKNGAGKSTLLKILSKVTGPTTGNIKAKGRIASLLEVGTGFHPELTGRENIYLNGTILGMTRREVSLKLDEIVDFAGVERYLDTPVKRYSSGMMVRLGFSVAAHLEPEILIVDEVLAVGDAEFQAKCIGKIQDVSKESGRTVLFVSHNMGSVKSLCNRTVLLKNGSISGIGNTSDIIENYLADDFDIERIAKWDEEERPSCEELELKSIKVLNGNKRLDQAITTDNDIHIEIEYLLKKDIKNLRVALSLYTPDGIHLFSSSDFYTQAQNRLRLKGKYINTCLIKQRLLNVGKYIVRVDFEIPKERAIIADKKVSFTINELIENQFGPMLANKPPGLFHPELNWKIENFS